MSDDVRVEPIPLSEQVAELKAQLRRAINDYRLAHDDEFPCGDGLQAYLRPGLGMKARRVNELAHQLRELDVHFPPDWVDLPTGHYTRER